MKPLRTARRIGRRADESDIARKRVAEKLARVAKRNRRAGR